MEEWFVYLLRTRAGALYAGISTDVARRLRQHTAGSGAKALRAKGPLVLVYQQSIGQRAAALRVEAAIKRWPKARKEFLVSTQPDRYALCVQVGLDPMGLVSAQAEST